MVKVVSFGCRINSFESEVFKEKLADRDDIVVVNTCAVTGEAERQCRQAIRKLKKENPSSVIVVTGCAAQINPQKFAQMNEVDLVLGNKEKTKIEEYLSAPNLAEKNVVGDIMNYDGYDKYIITGFEGRQKAFVQIQQGCNHRCTYCIIPFARGHNRSVEAGHIIEQINNLIAKGFKEICLTGVDICSYQPSFSGLVEQILAQTPQDFVLAFGSLDPASVDDKFIELAKDPRVNNYFHFSIQSGDNMILKRMRRRHNREDVINVCEKIRNIRPDAVFGADFICGFPTETDEQFENTCKLVDEAKISRLHVFPYSERSGTPAALMPQVDMNIRRKRAKILRQKGENNE